MKAIEHILIVGGGTAGWLTAAFLARTLGTAAGGPAITLVESSDIGIIGVGEASFPSIRGTLATIGITEADFLRECNGTFKQGIRYNHWVRPPGTPGAAHYFHPFSVPSQRPNGPELLPYWLLGGAPGELSFAAAATLQNRVVDAGRGPKRAHDGDYLGPLNYAYHFDAGRLAALLARHARALGVRHELATVERVELDEDGAIAGVVTRERGTLRAGLYIDCSGFRAALIGEGMKAPFRDAGDMLFNDRALALQVPYERADAPIAPYTIATAQESGWTWDIGLQERRGVGYVYSSRFTDDTRAEALLRRHIGPAADGLQARMLKLRVGYRETHWVKNCVAVGLAGGFLEPLESSGIGLIETAAYLIGYLFPRDGNLAPAAAHYNQMMKARYERVVDFIKLHYAISQRRDTPYWIANTEPASRSERLSELLAQWQCRPPHRLDFITDFEMYPPTSWQYVLYGMEHGCDLRGGQAAYPRMAEARQEFQMIQKIGAQALADLPDHRQLVEQLCARSQAVSAAGSSLSMA